MWRFSSRDSLLVLFSLTQFGLVVVWAQHSSELALIWNILLIPLMSLIFYYNHYCGYPQFLALPFFQGCLA